MPTRRNCLKAFGAGLAAAHLPAQVSSKADSSKLAMPGLYRGRVIAVQNPACIVSGQFQREPIVQMIRKGMAELTGTDGGADAWRQFAGPGDVVGLKLNPVGHPHVMSSPEVVREIIAGLNLAGVKPKEIVVYDRYRKQFFDAASTSGCRKACAFQMPPRITRRCRWRSRVTIPITTWTWR